MSNNTAPTVNQIHRILNEVAGFPGCTMTDAGLVYGGAILTPETIGANWEQIVPDDNDGHITDRDTMRVFGAFMNSSVDLWAPITTYIGHDAKGWFRYTELTADPDVADWLAMETIDETDGEELAETGTEVDPDRFGSDVVAAWKVKA